MADREIEALIFQGRVLKLLNGMIDEIENQSTNELITTFELAESRSEEKRSFFEGVLNCVPGTHKIISRLWYVNREDDDE